MFQLALWLVTKLKSDKRSIKSARVSLFRTRTVQSLSGSSATRNSHTASLQVRGRHEGLPPYPHQALISPQPSLPTPCGPAQGIRPSVLCNMKQVNTEGSTHERTDHLLLLRIPGILRIPSSCLTGIFPGGSDCKESSHKARDLGSIPGWGRSPGEGNSNPLQYSWPGEVHGQRSLVGCSPWGRRESDMTN